MATYSLSKVPPLKLLINGSHVILITEQLLSNEVRDEDNFPPSSYGPRTKPEGTTLVSDPCDRIVAFARKSSMSELGLWVRKLEPITKNLEDTANKHGRNTASPSPL